VRRALIVLFALAVLLVPVRAEAANKTIQILPGGGLQNANVTINGGDSVTWQNGDVTKHTVCIDGGDVTNGGIPPNGSFTEPFADPGANDADVNYQIDCPTGAQGTITVKASSTTTTTTASSTTTTTKPTTTSSTASTTTTSTSSTTTTTSTTTSTTTPFSSFSGPVSINDSGKSSGSSALPFLVGAFVVVAGLAGLAYWMWLRSGEPYDDEGPDWTDEPPTMQGPRI
jgi:plastocyanin